MISLCCQLTSFFMIALQTCFFGSNIPACKLLQFFQLDDMSVQAGFFRAAAIGNDHQLAIGHL